MNNNINAKLKTLKDEDLIWIISFFLVIASLISNQYEREAILKNNPNLNNISSDIKIIIFIVALFIYIYFFIKSWQNVENLKEVVSINNQKLLLEQFRLIASILFLLGGFIFLVSELQIKKANN